MITSASCCSFLVVIVAILAAFVLQQSTKQPDYLPWHNNSNWEAFHASYNESEAVSIFADETKCQSRYIDTKYGETHVYTCGNEEDGEDHTPVLFFHGAGSNSLIYGNWVLPSVLETKQHYCIAVDFVCDVGRSSPPEGDPTKCPQNQEELVEWIELVATALNVRDKQISTIGYSYGSFVSFTIGLLRPDWVKSMVWMAPASVIAPVETSWIWRAILYGIFRTKSIHLWFLRYMSSAGDKFEWSDMTEIEQRQAYTIRQVAGTVLAVVPYEESIETLRKVAGGKTLVMIGQNETVLNTTKALEHVQDTGIETVEYPDTGHLMLMEKWAKDLETKAVEFLTRDAAARGIRDETS